MNKRILLAFMTVVLILTAGCSVATDDTASSSSLASFKIERSAKISPNWIVKDIEIELDAGEELPVLLKLTDGNQVNGEFYLEEGEDVSFNITGNTVLYIPARPTGKTTSDRFSFSASVEQGTTYIMTFSNPATNSKSDNDVKLLLHLTYPDTAALFVPIDIE